MKRRTCKTCDCGVQLFMRAHYRIWKGKGLYCTDREKTTDKDGCCERWRPRRLRYDLSAKRFDDAEEDIAALMELLREE